MPIKFLNTVAVDTSVLYVDTTNDRVGIGITNPSQKLHVSGNARVTGAYYDSSNSPGTSGQVLSSTATGTDWVDASGGGGVTSASSSTNDNLLGIRVTPTTGAVTIGLDIDSLVASTLPNADEIYIPYYDEANDINRRVAYADLPTDSRYVAVTGDTMTGTLTMNNSQIQITDSGAQARMSINNTGTGDPQINFQLSGSSKFTIGVDDSDSDKFKISAGASLGSSDRIVVDSSGNVGIGTTSPGEKLTISGGNLLVAGDYQSLYVGGKTDSSQDGIRMSIDNAGNGYFDHRGSGLLNFRVDSSAGATTRMVINSSGNVGIGTTTNPQSKLHVANGTLRTWTPTAGTTAIFESTQNSRSFITITSANEAELWFGDGTTQAKGRVRYENNNDMMEFWTGQSAKMYINSSGNVGIGEENPDTLLHLSGNSPTIKLEDNVSGDYYNPKIEFFAGSSEGGTLEYISNPGFNGMVLHYRQTSLNNNTYLRLKNGEADFSSDVTNGATLKTNGALQVTGSNNSYFSNGNVGIGTVSPVAKLEVEGGDHLLQLSTTSSTGSPYLSFNQNGGRKSFIQHNDTGDTLKIASEFGGIDFFTGTSGAETRKMTIYPDGRVGIGTASPQSTLQVNGGVQLANDTASPSATKVGTFRYRTSGNNSYVDMCMQTGASTYAWVNIVANSW